MAEAIRVVLADDHVMVREALAQVLESSEEINVVGQADDGSERLVATATTILVPVDPS